MSELADVFRRIFMERAWANGETVCGPGSSAWATAEISQRLPALLTELGARSLLDAACGDFNWMRDVVLDVDYVGCDIVPELIAQNNRRYANSTRRFECLDIAASPLPAADVVLCRDCLGHLPFATIDSALRNFARSGSTYLLATTFPQTAANHDIAAAPDWRPLNLELPPLDFRPPLVLVPETVVENPSYPDKSLGLWRLGDLAS